MSTNPFDPSNPNAAQPAQPGYTPPPASNQPPPYNTPQYRAPEPGSPSAGQPEYGAPGSASYSQPKYAQANYGQPGMPPAGYPVPGQAPYPVGPQTGSGSLAQWPTRAYGALFDIIIPMVAVSIIGSPFAPQVTSSGQVVGGGLMYNLVSLLGIAFWVYNSGYLQGTTGKSIGKRMAKTHLISEETGRPIGFGMAVLRHICHAIDSVICFVGWLFPLWDPKRQTIADKIMKTVVVND